MIMVYAFKSDVAFVAKKPIKKTRKLTDHEKRMRQYYNSFEKIVVNTDSSGKVVVQGVKND